MQADGGDAFFYYYVGFPLNFHSTQKSDNDIMRVASWFLIDFYFYFYLLSLSSNHDTTSCFIRWIITFNDTHSNING